MFVGNHTSIKYSLQIQSCSAIGDFEVLATEFDNLVRQCRIALCITPQRFHPLCHFQILKAGKFPVNLNFQAGFLSSAIRKQAIISFLRSEPDIDSKIDKYFPVREFTQLSFDSRLVGKRCVN